MKTLQASLQPSLQFNKLDDTVAKQCNREMYPLQFVFDPVGTSVPDFIRSSLRTSNGAEGSLSNGSIIRFVDYDVLLSAGYEFGVDKQDALVMNLDRGEHDPVT